MSWIVTGNSLVSLTPEDFNASRVGDEVFAITLEEVLTAGGYSIGSVLRSPAFSPSHIAALDDLIVSAFGDHYSHTPSSWLSRTSILRRDIRSLIANLMRERNAQTLTSAVSWVTVPPRLEYPVFIQNTLGHLRSDATQALAYLLQKETQRDFSAEILEILSNTVFSEEQNNSLGSFAASPDGIEVKWILASHPDTPANVLAKFGPTDLQWLSILSHPNTSPEQLVAVITSALHSEQQGAMDGGNISAALSHGWWTTDNLRRLHKEIHPYLRQTLVAHLLVHPACPVELLERHYPDLVQPSLFRLASLSGDVQILEGLAFHEDKTVREAIKLNPRTPEHARVAAALGNLSG